MTIHNDSNNMKGGTLPMLEIILFLSIVNTILLMPILSILVDIQYHVKHKGGTP